MKTIVTLLTLTFAISTFGQSITLDIPNPAPRVGEEIEISVSINQNHVGSGSIKFTLAASDTGAVSFGPFIFTVDGQEYISDTLTVNVHPKLPPEKRGVWVRQVYFEGEHFLIIEQRIPNEWKQKGNEFSFNNEGLVFAEIDQENIDYEGLSINMTYSLSTSQVIDEMDINDGGMVSYKMTIYTVDLSGDYDQNFTLKKDHFKAFPKRIDFDEIKIRSAR